MFYHPSQSSVHASHPSIPVIHPSQSSTHPSHPSIPVIHLPQSSIYPSHRSFPVIHPSIPVIHPSWSSIPVIHLPQSSIHLSHPFIQFWNLVYGQEFQELRHSSVAWNDNWSLMYDVFSSGRSSGSLQWGPWPREHSLNTTGPWIPTSNLSWRNKWWVGCNAVQQATLVSVGCSRHNSKKYSQEKCTPKCRALNSNMPIEGPWQSLAAYFAWTLLKLSVCMWKCILLGGCMNTSKLDPQPPVSVRWLNASSWDAYVDTDCTAPSYWPCRPWNRCVPLQPVVNYWWKWCWQVHSFHHFGTPSDLLLLYYIHLWNHCASNFKMIP